MVTDQEPRYRLKDADGNVVGSLFAESDGTLKLQEGTSGNDNELSLTTQGALEVEQFRVSESGVRASLRSSQSISSGPFAQINFDNTFFDDAGEFDTATGEFTASDGGRYLITASVQLSGFSGGASKSIRISVNGSAIAFRSGAQDIDFATIEVSCSPRLTADDVVTVEVRQSSGSAATVESSDTATTVAIAQIA